MPEKLRFAVNENGENGLLYALKNGKESAFHSYREADFNPFIPSRFAQCAAGLLVNGFGTYPPYTVEDWRYENTAENAKAHGVVFSQFDLRPYTLPLLTGPHLAAAMDNMNKVYEFKDGLQARDAWGYTPLMYAIGCCHRNFNAMITLNPRKVFTNQGSGDCDPVEILLKGYEALPATIKSQKYFLARASLEPCDFSNAMTIHEAAARGLKKPLRRLLQLGVDINCRSFNGSTPLMCAAIYGQHEVCAYLLEEGADTSIQNHLGETYSDLYRASYHIFPSYPAPIIFSEDSPKAAKPINTASVVTSQLQKEPKSGHAEELAKAKSSNNDPFLEAFITSACNGQFQPMVAFFYKIKDFSSIPYDIVTRILKKRNKNQELIVDWIYYQCKKREINIEDIYISSKEYLDKFQFDHSINFNLEENSSLYLAAMGNEYGLYQWLLRHSALISLSPVRRTVLVTRFEPKFKRAWDKQQDAISREIVRNPVTIPDLLLYALTTDNIEFLDFCFFIGLSKSCKSTTGLTLDVIGDLIGIKDFRTELKKREAERAQRKKDHDVAKRPSDLSPAFTKPKAEPVGIPLPASPSPVEKTNLIDQPPHVNEVSQADVSVDLDKIRIKELLENLPIAEPLVDLFIECQSLSTMDDIVQLVDDPDTLELFIAFKVYLEEKIKSESAVSC